MVRTPALFALALTVALSAAHAATAPPPASTLTKDFTVPYPVVQVPAASTTLAREIRQGEYLARLSDCMACHTDHDRTSIKGKPFAGGLPMQTPFGVIYSRNITPDKGTGIGSWTFRQFDDAVRYGKSPQGYLFAAMPYPNYNLMSRAQVHAIWEYLKRVPAVHEENKPLGISAPFKWRWLQFGWRFLFYKPGEGEFKPDPNHSAAWNRGRFIVQGPSIAVPAIRRTTCSAVPKSVISFRGRISAGCGRRTSVRSLPRRIPRPPSFASSAMRRGLRAVPCGDRCSTPFRTACIS